MNQVYVYSQQAIIAKTASYSILVTDDEIDCAPAANGTVLTLPAHSTLIGLGRKSFKIKKTSTGSYPVKIVPTSPDTINAGQDAVYLFGNGEEVIVESSVSGDWQIGSSTVFGFMSPALDSGKYANIEMETNALTGQINGMEINMTGPNGAATGSNSYTTLRIKNFITGTSIMTARTLFVGNYSNALVATFSGQQMAAEFEVSNALVSDSVTTSVITLSTRSAQLSATYNNASAYIMIRDYNANTLGVGALPNIFSLLDANEAWTIPSNTATALFTTYTDATWVADHAKHALKMSVAGVSFWIPVCATAPH